MKFIRWGVLVLEVPFERNAARPDSGKLRVVYRTATGSAVKFSFATFFTIQPMLAAKPVSRKSDRGLSSLNCRVNYGFNKLVVAHGVTYSMQ